MIGKSSLSAGFKRAAGWCEAVTGADELALGLQTGTCMKQASVWFDGLAVTEVEWAEKSFLSSRVVTRNPFRLCEMKGIFLLEQKG